MMKKISTKKTVIETIVDQYKITDKIKMIATTINGILTSVRFCNKGNRKDFSCVLEYDKFRDQVKKYNPLYYGSPKHTELNTASLIIEDVDELFKLAKDGKLSNENFFYLDYACHRIEDVNGDYIDIMISFNYIGGFVQKAPECDYQLDWNWKKLKNRLTECKDVISFKEEEIPYYNSEFHGQMGLECNVIMRKEWVPKEYRSSSDILLDMERDPLGVKGCIKH